MYHSGLTALFLTVFAIAAAAAASATPSDIHINPQRHSDGPMLVAEDMVKRDRVVVFYHFALRDSATNDFYATLNGLATEFGRERLLVVASAAHRGHLNDVWAFSKDKTGSGQKCKVSLFQNSSVAGLPLPAGHGVIWAADGRLVYHGELVGRLDLLRQVIEGGGGMLPPGASFEHHAAAVAAMTALEQPVGRIIATLREQALGDSAEGKEAAKLLGYAESWATESWDAAVAMRALDATGHRMALGRAAALLAGDKSAERFAEALKALDSDREFRQILRSEAQLEQLIKRAEEVDLPKKDGDDPRANAARAQLAQALQRFIDRNPDTSIAVKANAALKTWELAP